MISDWMDSVESDIARISAHPYAGTPVGDVLDWAVSSKGKRVRPMLLILCSMLGPRCDERRNRLTLLAAMMEITHLSSLIHDDIVDDAPFRREKASVQSRFGKDAAVYAGDYLISRVQYFQAQEGLHEAGMILADAIGQMCAGEIGQAGCRYREDVTMQEYLCNIRGKTTALFRASCRIGALEGGCSPAVISQLDKLGEALGCMFQFRDDLLDFTTDLASAGKVTHKDFRDGIYTMPVLMAMRDPEAREKLLPIMRTNRERGVSCEQVREMEEIVRTYGGVETTGKEILRYRDRCREILSDLPQCPASSALGKIVTKCAQFSTR
ncbi:MAG TPA: polyprenyl synthetase [Lachnospiraceae bacterium]|nr:polyprenyl synthetase [Lachnospiraceae bacterium]